MRDRVVEGNASLRLRREHSLELNVSRALTPEETILTVMMGPREVRAAGRNHNNNRSRSERPLRRRILQVVPHYPLR
jgi:hypothetical protein